MSNKRMILLWIAVVFLSFTFIATGSFAKGKQKGQRSGTHSGWVKGEKKNWETDVSPGFEKKDSEWYEKGDQLKEKKQPKKNGNEANADDAKEMKEKEVKERERERKQNQQQSGEQEQHRERHREKKYQVE